MREIKYTSGLKQQKLFSGYRGACPEERRTSPPFSNTLQCNLSVEPCEWAKAHFFVGIAECRDKWRPKSRKSRNAWRMPKGSNWSRWKSKAAGINALCAFRSINPKASATAIAK